MAKKKPCQTKTLMQPGLQNGHCKTLLSPPRKASGFHSLPVLARASQAEQCPFGGWNSLSPCSLWVSDGAVTGRVPRGASGPCFQWPPALKPSFQWLTFDYCTSLCSSYHTTAEIPHNKDVDNKSPGSDGWLVSCCAGPLSLRAYPKWELCGSVFSPWQPHTDYGHCRCFGLEAEELQLCSLWQKTCSSYEEKLLTFLSKYWAVFSVEVYLYTTHTNRKIVTLCHFGSNLKHWHFSSLFP